MRGWMATVVLAGIGLVATSAAQQMPPAPQSSPQQLTPQQPTPQQPTLRIGVTAVEIDAVVTDGGGRHITDLQTADFELWQDDKPQTISSVRFVPAVTAAADRTSSTPPEPKADRPLPNSSLLQLGQARRVMAVVVDDLGMNYNELYRARTGLASFIEKLRQDDALAISATSRGVGRLQQFTNDKTALQAALKENLPGIGMFPDDDEGEEGPADSYGRLMRSLRQAGTLAAVQNIVRGMRDLPGRKSVVVISTGFSLTGRLPGNELARFMVPDTIIIPAFQRLSDDAARANVVIHTLDPRGVTSPVQKAFTAERKSSSQFNELSEMMNQQSNARSASVQLADVTGGLTFAGNDPTVGLGTAIADQEGYYVLAYQPDASTFSAPANLAPPFHRIKVQVKRRGLKVRTRSGFFGVPDDLTRRDPQTPAEKLLHAVWSPFTSNDIGVHVTSLFGRVGENSVVHVLLHLDGDRLGFTAADGGVHRATQDVLTLLVDARGAAVASGTRQCIVQTPAEPTPERRAAGFDCLIDVSVSRPGAYQVRVATHDAGSGRTGTAYQFLQVPDLAGEHLALSGIALQGSGPGGVPAVRRFPPASTVQYAFDVYNVRISPSNQRPALSQRLRLYRDGKVLVDGKPGAIDSAPKADGPGHAAAVAGELQLSSALEPGQYQLMLEVTDTLLKKDNAARQWIDFTVAR
jgi:VWFA-related protein